MSATDSRLVGEPFADEPPQRILGPLLIANAQPHSVVVSEIELCNVPIKVLFAAMLVDTLHAALGHTVEAF